VYKERGTESQKKSKRKGGKEEGTKKTLLSLNLLGRTLTTWGRISCGSNVNPPRDSAFSECDLLKKGWDIEGHWIQKGCVARKKKERRQVLTPEGQKRTGLVNGYGKQFQKIHGGKYAEREIIVFNWLFH